MRARSITRIWYYKIVFNILIFYIIGTYRVRKIVALCKFYIIKYVILRQPLLLIYLYKIFPGGKISMWMILRNITQMFDVFMECVSSWRTCVNNWKCIIYVMAPFIIYTPALYVLYNLYIPTYAVVFEH